MIPLRFGPPASSLYGVFHPAAQRGSDPRGVLLCNPFGQEAVRIHRLFRVLAERLAREGIACLRFDYHASGESQGDDHEADLDRWTQDIGVADALLRQRAGASQTDWVAPRLAGALAARASAAVAQAPRQIVLWDPVTDGPGYVQAAAPQADASALPGEHDMFGFGVSQPLLEQMSAIGPSDYHGLRAQRAVLIAPQARESELARLAADLQASVPQVQQQALNIDFDWTSEEALNTALVPADGLAALSELLTEEMYA